MRRWIGFTIGVCVGVLVGWLTAILAEEID